MSIYGRTLAGGAADPSATDESRISAALSGIRIAAISVMSFALALLVLTCGATASIAYHLRRAPEGFEDETGFHFSPSVSNQLPMESGLPLGAGTDVRAAQFEGQSNASRRHDTPGSMGMGVPQVREAH